jgi:hypothetical protein
MKIRIKGNTLRYRLTKSDVDKFSKEGYIEETINFGQQSLVYALKSASIDHLAADFQNNKITLFIPVSMAEEWITTDRVGFDSNESSLYLLIEKDFQCLDNVAEDQSDNYPNPLATC